MRVLAILGFVVAVTASDLACTIDGGTCLDWRYYKCTAGFETGKCDGDSNRKCCNNCNAQCVIDEEVNSSGDDECISDGGKCQHNTNYCTGSYVSGKCGGSSERQCCIENSGSSGGILPGIGCSMDYGNINNVDTTGASKATASQDGLLFGGVGASDTMAETDSNNMANYKSIIEQAGCDLSMDPAVIAGIISRETRAGAALGSDGFGSDGHGYGLMQVDDRYHTLEGGPYSLKHIKQGTGILIDFIGQVGNMHPTWTKDMRLKGGLSAYNAGPGNVQSYENMDVGTTGNDYGNDVTARSQWYSANGYN